MKLSLPSLAFSSQRIRAIMVKEFQQLRRDSMTVSMILIIPIMQLIIFGYAINMDPRHMPAALVVGDQGAFSRSFVAGLENSDYFKFRRAATPAEAQRLLAQGKIQFAVTIPENFERNLVRSQRPQILVEADTTDPTATAGAIAAMNDILAHAIHHNLTGPLAYLQVADMPVEVVVHRQYNPESFTRFNVVPGLIGVILTLTCIMMTALSITREAERGTMENLLAMPVRPLEVMAGKIVPYVLIGYIQAFVIVAAAKIMFDVPIQGNLLVLFSTLLVFIVCNLAIGFMLSASARNQMQAMQMSITVILPSILLTGFMFPFRGMPEWAQWIGSFLPNTYFVNISRGILLKDNGLIELWPHLWPLLLLTVLFMGVAIKRYRRTLD